MLLNYYHYFQRSSLDANLDKIWKTIHDMRLKIIFLSLPLPLLNETTCQLQNMNMMWPDYVWIAHSTDPHILTKLACKNQLIMFQPRLSDTSTFNVKFNFNRLTSVSFNSDNYLVKSCFISLQKQLTVDILQWPREDPVLVSNYSTKYHSGHVNFGSQIPPTYLHNCQQAYKSFFPTSL